MRQSYNKYGYIKQHIIPPKYSSTKKCWFRILYRTCNKSGLIMTNLLQHGHIKHIIYIDMFNKKYQDSNKHSKLF